MDSGPFPTILQCPISTSEPEVSAVQSEEEGGRSQQVLPCVQWLDYDAFTSSPRRSTARETPSEGTDVDG